MNAELPTPNIPLLRKAVEWAEAEREKDEDGLWDQTTFAYRHEDDCGTSFCIAGFAVMNGLGDRVALSNASIWPAPVVDGEESEWWREGRDVLGLTSDEADLLFDSDNSFEMVRAIAEQIAARAGERL